MGKGWTCDSNGRVPTLQVWSTEFKPLTHCKKKKEKEKNMDKRPQWTISPKNVRTSKHMKRCLT
jgi:hypothetical protein